MAGELTHLREDNDMLCEFLKLLIPVFDIINQVLGLLGLDEVDFLGVFGCNEAA